MFFILFVQFCQEKKRCSLQQHLQSFFLFVSSCLSRKCSKRPFHQSLPSVDISGLELDSSDVRGSTGGDSETCQVLLLITRWISLLLRRQLIQLCEPVSARVSGIKSWLRKLQHESLLHIFTHSSLCLSLSFFCLAPSPLPFDKPPLLPSHPSESCHSNRPYAHPYLHYCPNGFTCYQPHALVWIGIIWGTMGKLEARGPHRTRLSILCGPPEKSIIESLYHILLDGWYAVV